MKRSITFFVLFLSFVGTAQDSIPPGVVIAKTPAAALYTGSPSILILPNGDYLASHDYFGPAANNDKRIGTTKVYRSSDRGRNWSLVSTIEGQFWSNLFWHRGALYIFGTRGWVNDLVIRRSDDMGSTWTAPTSATNGLILPMIGNMGYHCAPMPVIQHKGKLWRAFEYSPDKGWGRFQSIMLSADTAADLLQSSSWTVSNYLKFDTSWHAGYTAWLEGNAVVTPDQRLVNVLRVNYLGDDIAAVVNVSDDGKTQSFDPRSGFIDFPGGCKKFTIRYDSTSRRYWALTNFASPDEKQKAANIRQSLERARNTLMVMSSADLINWQKHESILYSPDIKQHGFQYADWQFDGKDMIAAVRTAFGPKTDGSHDANHITFHRIKNFRKRIRSSFVDQ